MARTEDARGGEES
uniref:Uncharacterized protein n=1 Tax=Arundo donax TaxID=35708 RepID=A0A0A8ZIB7_ARUDO